MYDEIDGTSGRKAKIKKIAKVEKKKSENTKGKNKKKRKQNFPNFLLTENQPKNASQSKPKAHSKSHEHLTPKPSPHPPASKSKTPKRKRPKGKPSQKAQNFSKTQEKSKIEIQTQKNLMKFEEKRNQESQDSKNVSQDIKIARNYGYDSNKGKNEFYQASKRNLFERLKNQGSSKNYTTNETGNFKAEEHNLDGQEKREDGEIGGDGILLEQNQDLDGNENLSKGKLDQRVKEGSIDANQMMHMMQKNQIHVSWEEQDPSFNEAVQKRFGSNQDEIREERKYTQDPIDERELKHPTKGIQDQTNYSTIEKKQNQEIYLENLDEDEQEILGEYRNQSNMSQELHQNMFGNNYLVPGSAFKKKKYTMTDEKYSEDYMEGHDMLKPIPKVFRENDSNLSSLFALEYRLLDPTEPLIIDQGIMKYKPGFSINHVSRWVHVTKSVIRFYKNYYHSISSFRRPLAAIPIESIMGVKGFRRALKYDPVRKEKLRSQNPYDENQFEIQLKEDYESIYTLNKVKREIEDITYEMEIIERLDNQNRLAK